MTQVHADDLSSAERVRVSPPGAGYFPVMVNAAAGALLVVYRHGAGHMGRGGFLVSSRSEDAGRTWSEAVTVVETREYDDRNPAVGVAKDGAVSVAYHANAMYGPDGNYMEDRRDPKAVHTGVVRSADGGRTWGQPLIWTDATEWDAMSPYGSILTLDDGTMAMPIYLDTSWLLWSRDGGRTWGDLTPVADDINETAYCVLPAREAGSASVAAGDAEWVCLGRLHDGGDAGCMVSRRSTDGGRTWSDRRPFLPGRRLPADLLPLGDGSVLAVYGYRDTPCGARACRLTDGGRTTSSAELVLHDGSRTGDCGYPSAARADGWVVVAFYDAGECTTYDGANAFCDVVRLREEELIEALS